MLLTRRPPSIARTPARRILLIPRRPGRLVELGILSSFATLGRRELARRGVPEAAVEEVQGAAADQWEEAELLAAWLQAHPAATVAVFCSPLGSRHLRYILDRAAAPADAVRARVVVPHDADHDATNWWQIPRRRQGLHAFLAGNGLCLVSGPAPAGRRSSRAPPPIEKMLREAFPPQIPMKLLPRRRWWLLRAGRGAGGGPVPGPRRRCCRGWRPGSTSAAPRSKPTPSCCSPAKPTTRAFAAAALWKAGWAPRILVTTVAPDPHGQQTAVPPEHEINLRVLWACGVPAAAVLLLDGQARSTYDEAVAAADYLGRSPPQRLLVVTSGLHTRRAPAGFSSGCWRAGRGKSRWFPSPTTNVAGGNVVAERDGVCRHHRGVPEIGVLYPSL